MKLSKDIKFYDDVGPVCLAPPGDYTGSDAIVSGWGTQEFRNSKFLKWQNKPFNLTFCVENKNEFFFVLQLLHLNILFYPIYDIFNIILFKDKPWYFSKK